MNKRAIVAIIILMSTALLGLTLIQAYWINWSIKLNREKFDKNIFDALNEVAERLQKREISFTLDEYASKMPKPLISEPGSVKNGKSFAGLELDENLGKESGSFSKITLENLFLKQRRMALSERIDIEALDKYLNQELQNRGINLEFNYAVVSSINLNTVVLDGYYVFDESLTEVVHTGVEQGLNNTHYKVELFKDPDRLESPGFLMVYFPKLTQEIWQTLYGTLLGSLIFTGLILFCFSYTISVIFKQKKLSEMKTDFINNMTHEFKTPIATIGLAADSITSDKIISNPQNVRRFADIIRQENRRMLGQVEKVLQIALIDREKLKLNLKPIDLHFIIQDVVNNISLQIEHKQGQIETNLLAETHFIHGDKTHIENIIFNLLDNAIKYSNENLLIEIISRDRKEGIEIEFKDNGVGISKEQRKHIFDKFYRVHTGNLHDVKGFGLGLSYVKEMVEAHGGKIDVKSEIGVGSSFTIHFPMVYNSLDDEI
jgi:two-component system, OmpR family, phosphate regulon sensor histidine kinase PhoR